MTTTPARVSADRAEDPSTERPGTAVPALGRSVAVFAVIGALTTVAHLGLFALLRHEWAAQPSNAVALALATLLNTWANRRWTFGVTGRAGAVRHQLQGLLVFGLTLAMTSAALDLLGALWAGAPRPVEVAVVAAATLTSTAVKYLLMRHWIFAPGRFARAGRRRLP